MLMDVYIIEELDKIDYWIEKVSSKNKFMIGLYEDIQDMKNEAQKQFLEENKCDSASSLEIFGDKSRTQISSEYQFNFQRTI